MKSNAKKGSDVLTGRAISIQQPFVEQILLGKKKNEYRSFPTKIRGRVYLYASLKPRTDQMSAWKKLGCEPGDLPSGVIVGSVEIADCKYLEDSDDYAFMLKNPKRYKKHLKPDNRPQPCWFFPFGEVKGRPRPKSK